MFITEGAIDVDGDGEFGEDGENVHRILWDWMLDALALLPSESLAGEGDIDD